MKDSGVEWIGQIPEMWDLIRLKNCTIQINEKNTDLKMNNILSLSNKNGVTPYEDRGNQGNKSKEDLSEYKLAYKSTIIANSMNILIGSVGISHYDGCVSPVYYVFKNNDNADLRFLNYIMQTTEFQKQLKRYANGILEIRLRVSYEDLVKQKVSLPPLSEQQKIADFLDEKVKEIDNAIEKTKETIELYKKYKQAVITETVTKGLDPNAEMKDSGVEWIGKVPKDWKLVKSKYVVTITHGSDPMTSGKIPVYGSGGKSFRTCGEFKDGPCVLIGRKGATLNIPHYIIGKYWNIDTAFDVKTLTADIELKYYYYLATCFDYNSFITNTTLPSMTQADYNSMIIPLPSRKIQMKIIDWLDEKCDYIDKLIEQENYLILMIEDYKKSLIYEYVTGKKEVK